MANPRKFSEKIALHHQKQAEETAAFEKIMREVSDATQKVNSSKVPRVKPPPEPNIDLTGDNVDTTLQSTQQALGTFRSGSLPNVAAPQPSENDLEIVKPEDTPPANQYAMAGGRSGGTSPSRSPGQRGRTSSSVGPIRRPADRKHDTSPYGSSAYLSPPPDSNWRRTNSDSALHQSCGEQQTTTQPLSPHRPLHSHAHPHLHPHQNHHRRSDIHLDVLSPMNPANRPRSSCGIPNNNNVNTYSVYKSGGDGGGGGGLACGDMAVPGGSLPDLTSVHYPPPHYALPHRTSPDYQPRYNMSPLDHQWIPSGYQTHCSPPSQYSSTSNINIPSPTMVHSPGSPVESPQTDYNNLHHALLQPFEQITMLDNPVSSYNTTYLNHGSPHSPQATNNSTLTYPQSTATSSISGVGRARDPVAGGGFTLQPLASPSAPPTPATPASIPDIVLTDYSFGGEEASLRAGLDLDELSLLEDPTALVPDSAVEHEFRLDRL